MSRASSTTRIWGLVSSLVIRKAIRPWPGHCKPPFAAKCLASLRRDKRYAVLLCSCQSFGMRVLSLLPRVSGWSTGMKVGIKAVLVAGVCVLAVRGGAVVAQTDRAERSGEPSRFADRFFADFDLNRDGKVTRDEVNKALAATFASATHGGAMTADRVAENRVWSFHQPVGATL